MKHLITAAFFALIAAPAFAFHCPADMAQIDAALETASLSASDLAKVKDLRARGEAEHRAGNHQSSVDLLGQAKAILGL